MRKLTILFALLTLSVGLWADDLDDAKTNAIAAVNEAATDAKAAIDKASEYTAADAIKAEYKTKIDNAVAEAENALKHASTVAEVSEKQSIYTSKLNTIVAEAKDAIAPINALEGKREKVIGEIENARLQAPLPELGEEQKAYLNETIDDAVNAVKAATTTTEMDRAEAKIFFILSMYPAGKAEGDAAGYERAKDELPTDAEDAAGAVVIITKGDKTLKLVNPDSVKYDKQD